MRIWFLLVLFVQLGLAQQNQTHTTVTSQATTFNVDLSPVSNLDGASVTFRNSTEFTIDQPQVTAPDGSWPYSSSAVISQIPKVGTDQEIAISAWRYIVNRTGYYCTAGTKAPGVGYITDPIRILNGHGYACCEQLAATLAWVWTQLGYNARLATMSFHTVPEVYYDDGWHMMDPTHKTYYLLGDSSAVASTADVVLNPSLITQAADANGNDPIGWSAADLAQLYADYGSTLEYQTVGYSDGFNIRMQLKPHEQFTLHNQNRTDQVQVFPDQYIPIDAVNSGQFDWDLSFGNSRWRELAYAVSGVDVVPDSNGRAYLQVSNGSSGSITYQESSMFPVLALSVMAQTGSGVGSIKAYISGDGSNWSQPIPFVAVNDVSSYQLYANLSSIAAGNYSYFVKIELSGNLQIHKLRISPVVQVAKSLFPPLVAGLQNTLQYNDASPSGQGRLIEITASKPNGSPLIRGLTASSQTPESAIYSLAKDTAAANLVDGDIESLAYPASTHIDYVISMNEPHYLTGISIDWKTFGTDSRFVNSYTVFSRVGNRPWQKLVSGGFPGKETTDIAVASIATDVRIVADSSNWIGIYEVRLFGTTISSRPLTPQSVKSNVPESQAYSLSNNLGSGNLIDRDTNTYAYPASFNLDYQLSFSATTQVSWIRVTWGMFGTNAAYIDHWSLLSRNGVDQSWTTLAEGGFPAVPFTLLAVDSTVTDVRLVASSLTNWIGVAEIEFGGTPLLGGLSASSDIPQTRGFDAANVIDGDPNTIAYPGSFSIDYALDPGQEVYVDSSKLYWGFFGLDPDYIQWWRLMGLPSHGDLWETIATGSFPNTSATVVPVQNQYRKFRVTAGSNNNWIGMPEIEFEGFSFTPLRPPRPTR